MDSLSFRLQKLDSKESMAVAINNHNSTSSSSSGSTILSCRSTDTAISSSHRTHSGELHPGPATKPRHRRSISATVPLLPAGNICPSGRTPRPARTPSIPSVLGSGSGNYGHGSIVRSGSGGPREGPREGPAERAMASADVEEVRRIGNELYRKGAFAVALRVYDRAVAMRPESAACRTNRAAALVGLGRLGEAVKDCEEAIRIQPGLGRAHQRLASIYVR